jgi:hypothetical protein
VSGWSGGADVEEDELRLETELGKGGQGRVFRVGDVDDGNARLVYKEYLVPGADGEALRALVNLPATLSPGDRELLHRQTAWPLARVMRHGILSGFLMPEIPEKFFARNSAGNRRLRELQFLLYQPRPLWGEMVSGEISIRTRLSVASQCAGLLHLLHSNSLVVGDISMRNILWAPGPPPEIYFVDCDGIRRRGWRPVLPQAETPDWADPKLPVSGPDRDTDRYKLALLVARVLSRQAYLTPWAELTLLPGVSVDITAELRTLWLRAARPHGSRPDALDWLAALNVAHGMAQA